MRVPGPASRAATHHDRHLPLQVLGILKEMVTLGLAAALLGDSLTAAQWGGFTVVTFGALLYTASKERAAARACLARCVGPWGRLDAEEEAEPADEGN